MWSNFKINEKPRYHRVRTFDSFTLLVIPSIILYPEILFDICENINECYIYHILPAGS